MASLDFMRPQHRWITRAADDAPEAAVARLWSRNAVAADDEPAFELPAGRQVIVNARGEDAEGDAEGVDGAEGMEGVEGASKGRGGGDGEKRGE